MKGGVRQGKEREVVVILERALILRLGCFNLILWETGSWGRSGYQEDQSAKWGGDGKCAGESQKEERPSNKA